MDITDFVLAELPPSPARVLEIGCGSGELATQLADADYDVLAIDPEAPPGPIFRRVAIEDLDESEPFDAVVAQLSLHHVADLGVALDKVAGLLTPDGRLVIDDFGWERLDVAAAERVGIPYAEWLEEHDHLHTAEAMLEALDDRFVRRTFSWEPFLFREGRHVMDEEEERKLIAEGRLPAVGFRYVGER